MHARLGRFNAMLLLILADALVRADFETLEALEEVINPASVTREVSNLFDKVGEPVLDMCDVGVLSLAKKEGVVRSFKAFGLKAGSLRDPGLF